MFEPYFTNFLLYELVLYTTGEMLPFQERKRFRKILYSKITLAVLFVALIFVARGAWHVYEKAVIAQTEKEEAARKLAELKQHTLDLEESVVGLKSDRGIEEEIRQKFMVARPGEEVVVVVDDGNKKSKNEETSQKQNLWQQILGFLKGEKLYQ